MEHDAYMEPGCSRIEFTLGRTLQSLYRAECDRFQRRIDPEHTDIPRRSFAAAFGKTKRETQRECGNIEDAPRKNKPAQYQYMLGVKRARLLSDNRFDPAGYTAAQFTGPQPGERPRVPNHLQSAAGIANYRA